MLGSHDVRIKFVPEGYVLRPNLIISAAFAVVAKVGWLPPFACQWSVTPAAAARFGVMPPVASWICLKISC
jgi:hypothetical protein